MLEQVIRDTEEISLEDEVGEEEGKEESGEEGERVAIEPGSAAALLEEFIGRWVWSQSHVTIT